MRTRWSAATVATVHPSSILRVVDPTERARAFAALVDDLALARAQLEEGPHATIH